jgi:hypothetical protein
LRADCSSDNDVLGRDEKVTTLKINELFFVGANLVEIVLRAEDRADSVVIVEPKFSDVINVNRRHSGQLNVNAVALHILSQILLHFSQTAE